MKQSCCILLFFQQNIQYSYKKLTRSYNKNNTTICISRWSQFRIVSPNVNKLRQFRFRNFTLVKSPTILLSLMEFLNFFNLLDDSHILFLFLYKNRREIYLYVSYKWIHQTLENHYYQLTVLHGSFRATKFL